MSMDEFIQRSRRSDCDANGSAQPRLWMTLDESLRRHGNSGKGLGFLLWRPPMREGELELPGCLDISRSHLQGSIGTGMEEPHAEQYAVCAPQ